MLPAEERVAPFATVNAEAPAVVSEEVEENVAPSDKASVVSVAVTAPLEKEPATFKATFESVAAAIPEYFPFILTVPSVKRVVPVVVQSQLTVSAPPPTAPVTPTFLATLTVKPLPKITFLFTVFVVARVVAKSVRKFIFAVAPAAV